MVAVTRWSRVAGLAAALAVGAGSAQAQIQTYFTRLTGPTGATGTGLFTYDVRANSLRVQISFANLAGGNATAAHVHCCTAAPFTGLGTRNPATQTPTFLGFPAAITGNYDRTFDLALASTYRMGFINPAMANAPTTAEILAARDVLIAGFGAGTAYLNIHNAVYPGGEINGFLSAVPEPSTYALLGTGLGFVGLVGWRRRRA